AVPAPRTAPTCEHRPDGLPEAFLAACRHFAGRSAATSRPVATTRSRPPLDTDGSVDDVTDMIAGLLLAAGAGTRMGGPKALVRFRGELLVDRGVRLLQEAGCSPVHVVLGAACEDVLRQSTLLGPPADVIRPARQARPAPPGGTAGSAHRSDAVVQAGDAGSVEESRPQDGRPQDGQPQGRRTQESRTQESRTQESRSQGVRF